MNPSDEVIGAAIDNAPAGWGIIALSIVAVAFIVSKFILPPILQSRERIHMRELDVREREAQNEEENIKTRAGLTEQVNGLRVSNDNLATQTAAMVARLNESATRSHEMGGKVDSIDETTRHTAEQVEDIHRHLFREGTD